VLGNAIFVLNDIQLEGASRNNDFVVAVVYKCDSLLFQVSICNYKLVSMRRDGELNARQNSISFNSVDRMNVRHVDSADKNAKGCDTAFGTSEGLT
jgi:hypothetical protein